MLSHTTFCHKQRMRRGRHNVEAKDANLITRDQFMIMVREQTRCFHCSCVLAWDGPSSPDMPSLDRICNTGTYTKNNVVLACISCNDMRRDMTVQQFHIFLTTLAEEMNGLAEPDDYDVGTHNALAHMIYMRRCRDSKARGVWTAQQYVDLAKRQNYRCYYTGVKLRFPDKSAVKNKHLPWPCSFDQLDPQGGYGENTVLCLRALNFMRRNWPPEKAKKKIRQTIVAFTPEVSAAPIQVVPIGQD